MANNTEINRTSCSKENHIKVEPIQVVLYTHDTACLPGESYVYLDINFHYRLRLSKLLKPYEIITEVISKNNYNDDNDEQEFAFPKNRFESIFCEHLKFCKQGVSNASWKYFSSSVRDISLSLATFLSDQIPRNCYIDTFERNQLITMFISHFPLVDEVFFNLVNSKMMGEIDVENKVNIKTTPTLQISVFIFLNYD